MGVLGDRMSPAQRVEKAYHLGMPDAYIGRLDGASEGQSYFTTVLVKGEQHREDIE